MSDTHVHGMAQRLQDIRKSLDVFVAVEKGEPELLRTIFMASELVNHMQTQVPDEVDTRTLGFIEKLVQSLSISSVNKPVDPLALYEQGLACFQEFERWGDLRGLEQAIANWQRVVDLTPGDHPNMPGYLNNLGAALLKRFEQLGSLADLDAAISQNRKALDLVPDSHPDKPLSLKNLGSALQTRFGRRSSLADLEEAISYKRMAVDLIPDGHPHRPACLSELGNALEMRFEQNGSLADMEEAILQKRTAVDLTPDGHPSKPMYLNNLGNALGIRFDRHGSLADLEEAISYKRKAVDLTPDGHFMKPLYLNNLGNALRQRFGRYGSLADVNDAILRVQEAVNLTPDDHQNKTLYLSNLGGMLQMRFDQQGSLVDLEDAISHKRKALHLTPDGHSNKPMYLNNLAMALEMRFKRRGSLADLEDAILQSGKAANLTPDEHPDKPMYLNSFANVLEARFDRHGALADLDEAVSQKRKTVGLIPDGHPSKPSYLNNLGNTLKKRFHQQGSVADLEDAISQIQKAVNLTPDGHPEKPICLNSYGSALQTRFHRRGLVADLEYAILQHRKAVNLTPDTHHGKPGYLNNLGIASESKFLQSGAVSDLDDAILHIQKAIRLVPKDQPDSAIYLYNLSRVLMKRFRHIGDRSDLRSALAAAQESAESPIASSRLRLQSACLWAECCAVESTSSLSAFECAIQLLPRIAWLGLTVDDQYSLLAEAGSTTRAAVEAAIAEGEIATAVEWAEQGRSLVWQNLLSLRTPLDGLRGQHPELASRLQEISQHLEGPTETQSSTSGSNSLHIPSSRTTLAMEWDGLIEEVRSKPSFESFMKPRSFERLAPVARDGPIAFLNLGERRCDALVLLPDENGVVQLVLIPLERVTHRKAETLSEKLVKSLSKAGVRSREIRKHKTQGAAHDKNSTIKEILKTLWLDYVKPVMDGLAYQINLESPPRLWWCTTGPLAFLPLHAAGMYDVKKPGNKISDFVVSSYTPTLTALLDESSPISSDELKILTVAISNTPGAPLPSTEEEVRQLHSLAANLPVVGLMNEEATKKFVLEEMRQCSWAHLACHGEQVGGKPMESGLVLHDGELKLSEIIKTRLPQAEFAFLSACQTAVGDGGVPEESAHLAAGMLFSGYRGVVATMWSIQDDIAPRVAGDFYRYMFRNGKPERREAAYALHRALKSLQQSGAPFMSWVPFIHIGR